MAASSLEFRFRYLLHALVFLLGFWVPWERWLSPGGPSGSLWLTAAAWAARDGWMSFSGATILLLLAGIATAAAGAWLRTWGSAYLGVGVVMDGTMHGGRIVADGPYRYMRNPLYAGTMLHTLALALLMPPIGALFAVVLIGLMQARLILGEENFLRVHLGESYADYCAMVPRVLPKVRTQAAAGRTSPHWVQAAMGELYMIGVAASFAVLGWRYNAFLLMKCAVIMLGVSLVVRAIFPALPEDGLNGDRPAVDAGR